MFTDVLIGLLSRIVLLREKVHFLTCSVVMLCSSLSPERLSSEVGDHVSHFES